MPISYPYISTPLETKTELGIKRDLLRTNPSPLEVYLLVFKNIYMFILGKVAICKKKYQYYIRIFFNICAASDKVEEHFAQQNCFEHKNLVYEILLMKYEDFMTFLHLWDTVMQIFPWSIIECIIEEVKSNVKQLGMSISINYTDIGFVARFFHV